MAERMLNKGLIRVGSSCSSKLRRGPRSKADSQLAPQQPGEFSGRVPSLQGTRLTACRPQAGILVVIVVSRVFMDGAQSMCANPTSGPFKAGGAIA